MMTTKKAPIPAKLISNNESLEADGSITIYSLESDRIVALYEGLEVHEAMQENGRLRERVAALEAAARDAHLEMVAMGNRLNWDMKDYGFGPPYFFPVEFNSAMAELRELTAEGGE